MADLVRLSKFLSLMLRHKAEDFGLVLDENGFTEVEAVWEQITRKYGQRYTRADLDLLLSDTEAGKQRFERVGTRVRALYGHSAVGTSAMKPLNRQTFSIMAQPRKR